jgi:hypothetical protein
LVGPHDAPGVLFFLDLDDNLVTYFEVRAFLEQMVADDDRSFIFRYQPAARGQDRFDELGSGRWRYYQDLNGGSFVVGKEL